MKDRADLLYQGARGKLGSPLGVKVEALGSQSLATHGKG